MIDLAECPKILLLLSCCSRHVDLYPSLCSPCMTAGQHVRGALHCIALAFLWLG